ncbi:unnamed protein product [Tuber melanosporum]|uniref:(Perigord truffle) hypothetical protein n=1 Tax=Tuber melanosporum (strain Mel28) TaxID=656061 RepID=D5G663_TUBMM|nr:uncharacterized protein GSTUM_00001791001 [Tuber melanosporum]CAZ80006.1 unnamed protein product [Tuber melanosporum]
MTSKPTSPAEEVSANETTPSETSVTSTASTATPTPTSTDGSATPSTSHDSAPGTATASQSTTTVAAPENAAAKTKKPMCKHKKLKAEEKEKEKEKERAKKEQEEKEKAEREKDEREKKEKEEKEKEDKGKEDKKGRGKDKKKDKKKLRSKKSKKRSRKSDSESSDSSSSSDSSCASDDSDSDSSSSSSSSSDSSSDSELENEALAAAVRLILARKSSKRRRREKLKAKKKAKARKEKKKAKKAEREAAAAMMGEGGENPPEPGEEEGDGKERASVLEYKRVDELWDKNIHDYTITDTVAHTKTDKYSSFIFTVRRVFDYENKYVETMVDIKSILLKEALTEIIGDVRGVSLVEDVPEVDPNMLFNFLPEMEAWPEDIPLTPEEISQQIDQVKLLIGYLNTDYAGVKATLYPLLANSMITFDLLWALLKPNTMMYTTCAGSNEPRAFKLEYAQKESSFMRGKWWGIEGKYLEYAGKDSKPSEANKEVGGFGWGTIMVDIDGFKGARKISSLSCYPLEYRKDKDTMRETLVERGRKFVSLRGMQYKMHKGLAFMKKKRQYAKVHVKGRIMIDPATFRRINPNYLISSVKSRNNDEEDDNQVNFFDAEGQNGSSPSSETGDCTDCCCGGEGEEEEEGENEIPAETEKHKIVTDGKGAFYVVTEQEANDKSMRVEALPEDGDEEAEPVFTDDELLTASPVVLGWSFNEKLWLEFTVSGVEEIQWNEKAFDSLVLAEEQKEIVKALVESHSGNNIASATIDDVIQGKGRGLVSVLHGPPGVGKTLTAEGIAELLKKPLYCVSSGELGTNPAVLEHELNKILDIAHSWGAVLLLDEADVFLERRTMADMHRNALVSIFLRLLEYFQGILFLTTNRVETFDDAFQSRIHVALRYNELTFKAKVKIWKMFLEMVRVKYGEDAPEVLSQEEIEWLAKKHLNGRQIKNSVRTAQALANNKKERLQMKHIRTVLNVAEGFENDLKGTGQLDSMHAYA